MTVKARATGYTLVRAQLARVSPSPRRSSSSTARFAWSLTVPLISRLLSRRQRLQRLVRLLVAHLPQRRCSVRAHLRVGVAAAPPASGSCASGCGMCARAAARARRTSTSWPGRTSAAAIGQHADRVPDVTQRAGGRPHDLRLRVVDQRKQRLGQARIAALRPAHRQPPRAPGLRVVEMALARQPLPHRRPAGRAPAPHRPGVRDRGSASAASRAPKTLARLLRRQRFGCVPRHELLVVAQRLHERGDRFRAQQRIAAQLGCRMPPAHWFGARPGRPRTTSSRSPSARSRQAMTGAVSRNQVSRARSSQCSRFSLLRIRCHESDLLIRPP